MHARLDEVPLPIRPEVIDNNEAIVLIELDRPSEGLTAAQRAVDADPFNPVFLQTRAFAERRVGRIDDAAQTYSAALEGYPTVFSVANDLGVILTSQGR